MASFIIAYRKTIANEGLYSNDTNDRGGETVLGLTRVMDKNWAGWLFIDECKKHPSFPANLKSVEHKIDALAQPFYKQKYWMPVRGDEIINQDIANKIYDSCVNLGISQGVVLAQRSLGIAETGKMSDTTLNKLNNK
jgi:lysozyme family protein